MDNQPPNTLLQSPRMRTLKLEQEEDRQSALARFWEERAQQGGPFFEPLPEDDPEAGADQLITFVWRAEETVQHVLVMSALGNLLEPESMLMENLPGTDLWYKTYRTRADIRTSYCFAPDAPLEPPSPQHMLNLIKLTQPDPLNPQPTLCAVFTEEEEEIHYIQSAVNGPAAASARVFLPRSGVPAGTLEKTKFTSQALGNERDVWVYTPPGYEPQAEPYGLLLVFDGRAYTELVPTHIILDNLIAEGKIPPLVAVLPDNPTQQTRNRELPCHEPLLSFLERELIPWARRNYNLSLNPAHAIVAGSSYGGLAAAWAALRLPHLFGNVLSQAGAYWWRPGADWQDKNADEELGWLIRRYAACEKLPIRFYQDIGLLELELVGLGMNRHFRDVLLAKGYPVTYQEYYGGHDYACWRETLGNGLIALTSDDAGR